MRSSAEYNNGFSNERLAKGPIRGVGLAVINPDGELWVQRDLQSKERTGRRKGDLSIIFETGKSGESHQNNVLGALSELVNDSTLPQIQDKLVTVDGLRSTPQLTYGQNGSAISLVAAVTVLPHHDFHPVPHDNHETEPVGWMSPAVFLLQENVRPLARFTVSYLEEHGIIDQTLARYYTPEHSIEFVVPEGHNISEFHRQREEVHDMVPGVLYQVAIAV